MSKTDNTNPFWLVDKTRPRAYFRHMCGAGRWRSPILECDADEPQPTSKKDYFDRNCCWVMPYSSYVSPSREDCRIYWWGPERRRERENLKAMAYEYNAYGEIEDDDFPGYHHRNSAKWELW